MIINVENAGKLGIVKDIHGRSLPPEAWTDGKNVRFYATYAEKAKGEEEVMPIASAFTPYFLLPSLNVVQQFWVAATLASIHAHDGTSWTDISQVGGYNATTAGKWTGGVLSGLVLLNNPGDNPQYWTQALGVKCADLTGWPPAGVTTMRARVLRTHLSQIIVGDVTKDALRYPTMFKWSSAADPGALPSVWDETDATEITGERDLSRTPGAIIDMETAGDTVVIYKEDAVVLAQFVGETFVYDTDNWISQSFGIFSPNCVSSRPNQMKHIAFGYDDVVSVEGREVESVISRRNRSWLYNNIDETNKYNSFVVSNSRNKETWICFPQKGSTWCDTALVYNWEEETWGVRDLPDLAHQYAGVYDPNATPAVIDDITTTLVNDMLVLYDERDFDAARRRVIGASPTNQKLYNFDTTEQFDGVSFESYLERLGMAYTITNRGHLVRDFENRKLIKHLYPQFTGSGTIDCYVGGQETPDGAVTWKKLDPYTIGVTKKLPVWLSTVIPSFRFVSNGNQTWQLSGYSYDQELVGRHW